MKRGKISKATVDNVKTELKAALTLDMIRLLLFLKNGPR